MKIFGNANWLILKFVNFYLCFVINIILEHYCVRIKGVGLNKHLGGREREVSFLGHKLRYLVWKTSYLPVGEVPLRDSRIGFVPTEYFNILLEIYLLTRFQLSSRENNGIMYANVISMYKENIVWSNLPTFNTVSIE